MYNRLPQLALLLLAVWVLAGCTAAPVRLPSPPAARSAPVAAAEPAAPSTVSAPLPCSLPPGGEAIMLYAIEEEQQVARRLAFYHQEAERWRELAARLDELVKEPQRPDEWNRCLAQLEAVVGSYHRIGDQLRDLQFGDFSSWPATAAGLSAAYRADLDYQASDCAAIYRLAELTATAGLDRFHAVAAEQMEAAVRQHAAAVRVPETLRALEDLRRAYPARALSPVLLHQISISLARGGAGEEALRLLAEHESVSVELEAEQRAVDPARLRADLLLIYGRPDEALRQYEKIAARHAARAEERAWVVEQLRLLRGETVAGNVEREIFFELLRDYVLFDGRIMPPRLSERLARLERLYPGGALTHRARLMVEQLEGRAGNWLERQQARIEELLAAGEYDEAIARLEALLTEELAPQQRTRLRELLAAALSARRHEEERRRQLELQALVLQWEEGNRLLGLRRFDEAIGLFSQLLESEYREEAWRRLQEAKSGAVTELRRQAAELFVRARRSGDSEQGRELAVESWRLLRRIIDHYPGSDIVGRVQDNLHSVEEYLERLEPGLTERLRDGERAKPGYGLKN